MLLSQAITKLRLLLLRFGVGDLDAAILANNLEMSKIQKWCNIQLLERPASAIYIHKYLLAKYEIAAECYHLSNFQNTFNRYIYQNQNIFGKEKIL